MSGAIAGVSGKWDNLPLREILTKSNEWIDLDPNQMYRQVTVRMWGQGVVQRNEVSGAEIAAKRMLAVHPKQFIVSRIDARHGATGLIPKELDGAIVTNDFPVFIPDSSKISPKFLSWMSKTHDFVELCKAASEGTTNRVRLKEEKFLAMEVSLPPLEEQRRIVRRIEELVAKVEEARGLRSQTLLEIEALIQSARRRLIGESPSSDWITLGYYVQSIENGKSPSCEARPAQKDEWGVVKVGCVSFGVFDPDENKALPKTMEPNLEYEIHPGDFLMSRANTTQLVGACTVVEYTRPKLLLSDKIFRFIFKDPEAINTQYLDHVLKSPALRNQIERQATGTSLTMKNISKEKVKGLLIPQHSISEQEQIVSYIGDLQKKVKMLQRLQSQTAAELDALLPSILDKAFKGEL